MRIHWQRNLECCIYDGHTAPSAVQNEENINQAKGIQNQIKHGKTISWKTVIETHISRFCTLPLYRFWNSLDSVKHFPLHTPKFLSLTLFCLIYIYRVEQCIGVKSQKDPSEMKTGCLLSLFYLSYQSTGHRWISGTLIPIPNHFHPKQRHRL